MIRSRVVLWYGVALNIKKIPNQSNIDESQFTKACPVPEALRMPNRIKMAWDSLIWGRPQDEKKPNKQPVELHCVYTAFTTTVHTHTHTRHDMTWQTCWLNEGLPSLLPFSLNCISFVVNICKCKRFELFFHDFSSPPLNWWMHCCCTKQNLYCQHGS